MSIVSLAMTTKEDVMESVDAHSSYVIDIAAELDACESHFEDIRIEMAMYACEYMKAKYQDIYDFLDSKHRIVMYAAKIHTYRNCIIDFIPSTNGIRWNSWNGPEPREEDETKFSEANFEIPDWRYLDKSPAAETAKAIAAFFITRDIAQELNTLKAPFIQ